MSEITLLIDSILKQCKEHSLHVETVSEVYFRILTDQTIRIIIFFKIQVPNNFYFCFLDRTTSYIYNFSKDTFSTPIKTHHSGKIINKKVIQAREPIKYFINSKPNERLFSSEATVGVNIMVIHKTEFKVLQTFGSNA